MRRVIIVLILLIFFNSNFVYGQTAQELRGQIIGKIDEIVRKFSSINRLLQNIGNDGSPVYYACRYINGNCYRDEFPYPYIFSKFIDAKTRLRNFPTSSISNYNTIIDLWNYIFPDLNISNFGDYEIGMGVDEGTLSGESVARDVIRIFIVNNNDGERGTNYIDFFSCANLNCSPKNLGSDSSLLRTYLNFLRESNLLEKIENYLNYFSRVIQEYDGVLWGNTVRSIKGCLNTLNEIRNDITSINDVTTLSNILTNLNKFSSAISSSTMQGRTIPDLLETIYKQGFLITFNKTTSIVNLNRNQGYQRGFQNIYPNQIEQEADFWNNLASSSQKLFNDFFRLCLKETLITGQTPGGNTIDEVVQDFQEAVQNFNSQFSFNWVELEIATTEVPIAVIPPVVWVDEHRGAESLGEITPERIFDEVRNFIFDLAPIIFIILLIVGAIFYVISPIKVEYIKTGSEYLKWAVIGYFLLLVVSAIFSALKFIFGSP